MEIKTLSGIGLVGLLSNYKLTCQTPGEAGGF